MLDRAALGLDAWMSVRWFGGTLQMLLDALRHCVKFCPRPVPDLVIATFCLPYRRICSPLKQTLTQSVSHHTSDLVITRSRCFFFFL